MILSMKTLKRTIIGLASLAVLFTACNDFEEINKDPNAVDESAIKVSYLLNKSIMGAQQNISQSVCSCINGKVRLVLNVVVV